VEFVVPVANWPHFLAQYIEEAHDGDTIVVYSRATKELGERAWKRMCPDKVLTFKIKKRESESETSLENGE
jgi:hypothetical protein